MDLITFQSPVYAGWNDGRLFNIGIHAVDQNMKKTTKDSDAKKCDSNVKPMGECTTMQQHDHGTIPNILTKDWIVNYPKYRHLFSGTDRFKCPPVNIEMKPDTEPVRKAVIST